MRRLNWTIYYNNHAVTHPPIKEKIPFFFEILWHCFNWFLINKYFLPMIIHSHSVMSLWTQFSFDFCFQFFPSWQNIHSTVVPTWNSEAEIKKLLNLFILFSNNYYCSNLAKLYNQCKKRVTYGRQAPLP
jgi:hypothetical protein